MNVVLSIFAFISAMLCIRADYVGARQQVYLFKPLTMVFIILLAIQHAPLLSDTYKWLIISGLIFSLVGDVWLMMPDDRFIQGLVSFLIAHIFYIAAFSSIGDHIAPLWALIPLGLIAAVAFAYLRPGLGKYLVPVVVYMTAILIMSWQSFNQWQATGLWWAVVGALLFMLSDTILAINRFRQHFHPAQALILGTYFLAQWFIAQSI